MLTEAYDQYRSMLARSAEMQEARGKHDLSAALKQGQGKLRDLLKLKDCAAPVVAFVGLTNAGKSTLLSALFGAKVAPTGNRPWSSVPVEYRYGDEYRVSVAFSNAFGRNTQSFDNVTGLQNYIEQYATVGGGMKSSMLYAWMPSAILENGLVIADTPGFGAALAADGERQSDALLEYLPHADYVFWVIKSLQGVTRSEMEFYERSLAGRCTDIVVNCFDDFSASDRAEFRTTNEKALGTHFNWHFVDAKSALKGCVSNDASAIERSGLNPFVAHILALSGTEARRAALDEDLKSFFADVRAFHARHRAEPLFRESMRLNLQYYLEDLHVVGEELKMRDIMLASL